MRSYAAPLLYARQEYGETNPKALPSTRIPEPEPLEINLDKDVLGHLLVGPWREQPDSFARGGARRLKMIQTTSGWRWTWTELASVSW